MRLAIISDIHGNLEAFDAVLADIDETGADRIISLGDNIGYGPEHDGVMHRLMERDIPSVAGNHELVVQYPSMRKWFNPVLRETLDMTKASLSPEAISRIMEMPNYMSLSGCRFVHGFPPYSPSLYLFQMSDERILRTFQRMDERLFFVGHTHELARVEAEEEEVRRYSLRRGITPLPENRRHIVNAGSVGQPRDGDNRAKYLIWDDAERTLDVRFVPYDVEAVVRKILNLGYPEYFATRLR